MPTGILDIGALLAANNQTIAQYGIDRIAAILAADMAAYNRIVRGEGDQPGLFSELVDFTTDRQRMYGISTAGTMMESDEYSRPPTQVQAVPPLSGFPLRLFHWPIGWTAKWFQTKTPQDMAIAQQGAQTAHLRVLIREIKKAFFLTANYTFNDKLVDKAPIAVKRLLNADSAAIPNGPNGEVFNAATHNHYFAEAALSAAGLQATIDNVVEHGVVGPVIVAISPTNETAVKALTGFTPAADPRIILATNANQAEDRLNMLVLNNRLIGYFGAAEVWTKPWAIAGYAVVYDAGAPEKPLALRQREQETLQGLRVAAELDAFPLHAETMEAEFGVGVWARTKAAIYHFANAAYQDPTITS